ncbi:glycosyltransferase family 2 protein [Saccharospirillum mangrovi]|uniref:glycosyltransferase family 2 protein n=1 Tax=Saccharospirillum mangrovi TaxID=2161747 RepID=UPI001300844B|nr:glycosyltransferase family 2 protein [Saccharospirillum mangrovi]
MTEVAVVLVTFNRLSLLQNCLAALASQSRPVDQVYVINNASTDGTTEYLNGYDGSLALHHVPMIDNLGGAGGFSVGVEMAYLDGADYIWLMDDDVAPHEHCLQQLLQQNDPVMACLRENSDGQLVERASQQYDLTRWWIGNPRRASIEDCYAKVADVPDRLSLAIATFEGLFVQRKVVKTVGLPDPNYFIFLDDVDYCLRIRQAGFDIRLANKAILKRQLPMVNITTLSWKSAYVYRNFFYVHFVYGENWGVRCKPYLLVLAATLVKPFSRQGWKELPIIWRALFAAQRMLGQRRRLPLVAS